MRDADLQARFERALESFVARARADEGVLAAIVFGSLENDVVWEKSDIDLILVTRQAKRGAGQGEGISLVEADVNLHVLVFTRDELKKLLGRELGGSFFHSALRESRLLFARDESLERLHAQAKAALGSRDQRIQLFFAASEVVPCLYKAQKFCFAKGEPEYAFLWICRLYDALARVEVLLHGEVATREVVQQALKLNPTFFDPLYSRLIHAKKTERRVREALESIDRYLEGRTRELFSPLLDYLSEPSVARSATDIDAWCRAHWGIPSAVTACEWLADKGVLTKLSLPVRISRQSTSSFEELAFLFESAPPF